MLRRLSKIAALASSKEQQHLREGHLGPGVPARKITPLPTVKKPQLWEVSAHPHHAERVGRHTDLRLGNPQSGVAHSYVLPRRTALPGPGEAVRVIPTYDHSIPYMDFFGRISTKYGRGVVERGRRTQAEVYHADGTDEPGTKLRFNLYEGTHPEEYSIRKDKTGKWFLHNKTQTRERRSEIPVGKPSYKEIPIDLVNPADDRQAMMVKLDGAHTIVDLRAGRAPRLFSYRVAKKAPTGLIEHTHKLPKLLEQKVPKELDRTILRAETIGIDSQGNFLPAEVIGGLLNAKVWESRKEQARLGARLKTFPFSVVQYRGRNMEDAPFNEKLEVLEKVERLIDELEMPEMVTGAAEKIQLLNIIKAGKHPLTDEGVVLVDRDRAASPIKAKLVKDYDVFVRKVHPAVSAAGKKHDRAGAVSYSWTPDGPVAGQVGGFKHQEAREMLSDPDKYVGRVAKVKARKVFTDKEGNPKALFQPRFKEWHMDKGDIEKLSAFLNELEKISAEKQKGLTTGQAIAGGTGTYLASGLASRMAAAKGSGVLAESISPSGVRIGGREIKALRSTLSKAPVYNVPAGWEGSLSIPKGGLLPKLLRPLEEAQYEGRGIPHRAVRTGFERGAAIAPLRQSPEFLAHELGHLSLRDPKKTNLLLRTLIRARTLGPLAGLAGGSAMAMQDPDSLALKLAPAATAAGFAPLLTDEALASRRGVKALRQIGRYTPAMRSTLLRAFGTYAIPAAAATIPIGIISYLRSRKKQPA